MQRGDIYQGGKPFWAGTHQDYESATSHYLVAGCTGSGKSLTIQLLMQSVLPRIESEQDSHRALIYDSKQDLLPVLAGMIDPDLIYVLSPLQKLGSAWHIAADIDTPSVAYQLAEVLIPVEANASQPFFSDAARHLLAGTFIALRYARNEEWTLRDALLAVRSAEMLKAILLVCPYTQHLAVYFQEGRESASIMSTLATKLARFEPIAAASEKCSSKLSLKNWCRQRSIILLMNDDVTRAACDALNLAIFQRISQILLGHSDNPRRRTWVFLDEVREAGKIEGLSSLLNRGRSKGVCVVMGFQDIEGLREVHGEHLANELVGQCGSKAIFRLQSPETAKWAEGFGGSLLREETSINSGFSTGGSSNVSNQGASQGSNSGDNLGSSRSLQERKQVYDSEFLNLPFPDGKTLTGFYFIKQGFGRKSFDPFCLLSPRRTDIPGSLRRQEFMDEILPEWTAPEKDVFGLTPPKKALPTEQLPSRNHLESLPEPTIESGEQKREEGWLPDTDILNGLTRL